MMDWWEKNKTAVFCFVIILAATGFSLGLNSALPLVEDSGIYINMAKSLAHGKGFIYTGAPGDMPANYYPIVFPAILAICWHWAPGNLLVLKSVNILFALLFIGFLFRWSKIFFKDRVYRAAIVFIALSWQIAMYSRAILTEMPYIFFSTACLYVLMRYNEQRTAVNRYLFLSMACFFLACYTRLIGVSLLISALAYFFIIKRDIKKGFALSAVLSAALVPWILRDAIFGRSAYISEFSAVTVSVFALVYRWIYNLAATVSKELPDLFLHPFFVTIDPHSLAFVYKAALGCFIAVIIAVGAYTKLKREGISLIDTYVFIYFFFMYLTWTHHGARYLVPIFVFLAYYLMLGLRRLIRPKAALYGLIAALIAVNIAGNIQESAAEQKVYRTPAERSFVEAVDWVKAHAPADSIVLSRWPAWVNIYTGVFRGVKFIRTADIDAQYRHFIACKVDYCIIDNNPIYRDDAKQYLLPLVQAYPDSFERMYVTGLTPVTQVYRMKRFQ
jgi:hypothetical protein